MTAEERSIKAARQVLADAGIWIDEEQDSGLHALVTVAAALRDVRAEAIEEAAKVCELIRGKHKDSHAYPLDMGGLAEECAAAIRALTK